MARQPTRNLPAPAAGGSSLARSLRPVAVVMAAVSLGVVAVPSWARAPGSADSPRAKAPGTLKPDTGSLLVEYYENFLRTRDLDAFTQQVPARFTREGLARLVESSDGQTRRAAIFALGHFGGIEDNALLARALRDDDPIVRSPGGGALWAVWFRADTPENNRMLGTGPRPDRRTAPGGGDPPGRPLDRPVAEVRRGLQSTRDRRIHPGAFRCERGRLPPRPRT